MSATARLGRLVPAPPSRESALTRLRLRVRRDELDRKLAAGADPHRHHDVRRPAQEPNRAQERRRIARAIDRVIADACGSPPPPPPSDPRPCASRHTPRLMGRKPPYISGFRPTN